MSLWRLLSNCSLFHSFMRAMNLVERICPWRFEHSFTDGIVVGLFMLALYVLINLILMKMCVFQWAYLEMLPFFFFFYLIPHCLVICLATSNQKCFLRDFCFIHLRDLSWFIFRVKQQMRKIIGKRRKKNNFAHNKLSLSSSSL